MCILEKLIGGLKHEKILKDFQIEQIAIKNNLFNRKIKTINLVAEGYTSKWLNALPLKLYIFNRTKSDFRDGISLRYGWETGNMPIAFAYGKQFTNAHSIPYPKSYILIR